MRYTARLFNAQQGYAEMRSLWQLAKAALVAGHRLVVTVSEETRNSEQNSLMWVYLQAFAEQLQWPVNGAMVKLTPEEWKDILSAAYKRESQRVAMGLDGGMVMLGLRTSKMGKREFAEFIEFIQATAAHRGVEVDEVTA
jgi:inactivated superfamily I helicase